ncbi:MAG: hypothetical protein A4E67_01888 [Syntrophaceae bacterium PtaB.Bin038]|nr:MAG: hypothetical protein A4E67_01888 [Syntrophaceae bacterium PtaB.Bin038]
MKVIVSSLLVGLLVTAPALCAAAYGAPKCLARDPSDTVEYTVAKARPSQRELLARLVYAEALSTGIGDDPLVHEAIAWGVMNRVRLAERSESAKRSYGSGIRGVVFKKDQFNPAVSPRSPFSKDFLCPKEPALWKMAFEAAGKVLAGGKNPFIQTLWEQENGLSLVVNFYYPKSVQAQGPHPPWEDGGGLEFIGDVMIGEKLLPAEHVRFYRLARPPADLKPAR